MTTVFQEDIKCSVCGEESNHGIIGSTSTFGSADLDTRPPELERSTIVYDIQYCPHCTYCASSLSGSKDINLDHLKSDAYKEILSNTKTPETARYYLAASHLAEITNNLRFAFWHAIRATWICDDSGDDDIATECRNRTIRLGQQAIASSMIISDQ